MARMLYLRDSASFMLNAVRRHRRLCNKISYGASYSEAILPAATALEGKYKLLKTASGNREDAYDDVMLADSDLDNIIRDTFDTWKPYLRNHQTDLQANRVFPDGKFSNIIRLPYADEPNEADGVAAKIESLGATHPLYPLAARIKTQTAVVRNAIAAHKEAIRKQKLEEAEVEIAKMDLVRAYEVNYLDARKQNGAIAADRLFPQFISRDKDEAPEKPENSTALSVQ